MDHVGVIRPRVLKVASHLTHEELLERFRNCRNGTEKLRWQAVLLKLEGRSTVDIADICKRRVDWVRRTVRRYSAQGAEGMPDQRGGSNHNAVLDDVGKDALRQAILGEDPPGGGLWTGRKVARWIDERTGVLVSTQTGLNVTPVCHPAAHIRSASYPPRELTAEVSHGDEEQEVDAG